MPTLKQQPFFTVGEIEEYVSPKYFFWREGTTHQAPVITELGPPWSPACHVIMVASPVLSVPSPPLVLAPEPVHNMAATSEPLYKKATTPEPQPIMASSPEPLHRMGTSPEPLHKMAVMPKSSAVMDVMPESSVIMDTMLVFPAVMNDAFETSKTVPRQPRLMSSMVGPPLMSYPCGHQDSELYTFLRW